MFTTLIESTPQRHPNNGARVVSALFHSALIAAAVYATTSGAASDVVAAAATQAQKVIWVNPAQPAADPSPNRPAP